MKMNICFISKEYPPETALGGIGTFVKATAEELVRQGHQVHVISFAPEKENIKKKKGVVIHRVRPSFFGFRKIKRVFSFAYSKLGFEVIDNLIYSLRVKEKYLELNKEIKFDVVEVPEFRAEGFFLSFESKVPLVTRLHTSTYLAGNFDKHYLNLIGNRFQDIFEKIQTKNSKLVISCSNSMKKIIAKKWGIKKIKVLPNGKNIDFKGNTKEKNYALFLGRLEKRKGTEVISKALPLVFRDNPNFKMIFVGDCSGKSIKLKKDILKRSSKFQNQLDFTGFVSEKEKEKLLRGAKVVILPSIWENFPYTCLEAMNHGKIVIGTKKTGFEDMITSGKNGLLIKSGDYVELSRKIIDVFNNKYEKMGNYAKVRVKNFKLEKVIKDYVSEYRRMRK